MELNPEGDERHGRRSIIVRGYRWYAEVTLDRDGYVDRSRVADYDASLAPGFAEAADRCTRAGIDRLRVSAPVGDFTIGADARYVNLYVPYEHVDEAVEALRAAELTGDLTGLKSLTEKLEVPLDKWLASGARTLKRGQDFACTANRLREVLRDEAKARGLLLNARIVGPNLFIRPQPGIRRPAFSRTRSRRAIATHVPTQLKVPTDCVCGWSQPWAEYSADQHDRWHSSWSVGVPVSPRLSWDNRSIAVVEDVSPYWWRKLAYECAQVARRDGGYDVASFPLPLTNPEPEKIRMRAYLCNAGQRAVGYLAVSRREGHRWFSVEQGATIDRIDAGVRPSVDLIFVADAFRRSGIASALLAAYAEDEQVEMSDLSWSWPVSSRGRGLAAHHAAEGFWTNR